MYVTFKENTMKPIIAVLIAAALTLAGCNTLEGFGQDVQKVGGSIEEAGSKAGN
jgi:entericidin A